MKVELLIIDPQVDFCDPKGALYVSGAEDDMKRLSGWIKKNIKHLSDINVTLDSHHLIDIAHPGFWRDSHGKHPDPFTIITAQEVEQGIWQPRVPNTKLRDRAIAYVKALESGQRYPLCIWPPHCLIGSPGHAIYPELREALDEWAIKNFANVNFVTKGSNPWTEHYSAVKAEVPDPNDPSTQINAELIQKLMDCDQIVVAGEAKSHCLANTVRDIADEFGDDSYVEKIVLLEDATAPVTGAIDFTPQADQFVQEMKARGMKVSTTADYMPLALAQV